MNDRSGLIRGEKEDECFQHRDGPRKSILKVGMEVEFELEESYDWKKSRESLKAVNIRPLRQIGKKESVNGFDRDKVDEVTLALLYLTLHEGHRAWKGHDWEVLNRLHEKGWIENPRNKAKSVIFTEEGLAEAAQLFEHYFGKASET